jgi:hypothetical protein
MMAPDAEVALARSAAPDRISARATVKILTTSGYKVAAQGDNGFVCIVMRGWSAAMSASASDRDLVYYAKLRAPICFDPVASRTVLPLQELQTRLGMEGKGPDQIAAHVRTAYARGALPRTGSRRVASPHDGVHAPLPKLDARRKRDRERAPGRHR